MDDGMDKHEFSNLILVKVGALFGKIGPHLAEKALIKPFSSF